MAKIIPLAFLLTMPVVLPAQNSYCPDSDARRRVIAVNVFGKDNLQVRSLAATHFRSEFRGQPVKIDSLRRDKAGRVVILLDISQRMAETRGKWRLALAAAEDLSARLEPGTEMALVTFDDSVRSAVGFDQGRAILGQTLASFRSPSWSPRRGAPGNPIPDAIEAALRLLGLGRTGDVIYVITDGMQFGPEADKKMAEMERALIASGVRLFSTEFAGEAATYPAFGAVFFAAKLQETVQRTGGSTLRFETNGPGYRYEGKAAQELSAKAASLYGQMQEFYRLEVELPRLVDKLQDWKVEVADERGQRRKDLVIIYPPKLVPCLPQQP